MADAGLDWLVWTAVALFFVLLGLRAWVVEAGSGRLGRSPARVQVLTVATGTVLAGLVVLLAVQGGALLVTSILTGTDPLGGPAPAGAPAAVDPAVVPVAPAAPPAGG